LRPSFPSRELAKHVVLAARRARVRDVTERHLLAATGGASLVETWLDGLTQIVSASAARWEPPSVRGVSVVERLELLDHQSEQLRIVSLIDEDGRLLGEPVLLEDHGRQPERRRHPRVGREELGEHLVAIPRNSALRLGWAVGQPFMRAPRGPFVVVAASFKVLGANHPTGDPCYPGSRHVLAAEVGLNRLATQLRIGVRGRHEVLLLDEQHRVLNGPAPLGNPLDLGSGHAPQALSLRLHDPGQSMMLAALAPMPRFGWSVLVRDPETKSRGAGSIDGAWFVWTGLSALCALCSGLVVRRTRPSETARRQVLWSGVIVAPPLRRAGVRRRMRPAPPPPPPPPPAVFPVPAAPFAAGVLCVPP
jgi:hypothetical protein